MTAKNTIIGERIRDCRKKNSWSQEQLAEKLQENFRLNTDRFTISKWETGFQEPTMYPIKCMSELFGVAMDYLTGHSDNPTNISDSQLHTSSLATRTMQSFKPEYNPPVLQFKEPSLDYSDSELISLTSDEQKLLSLWRQASPEGQQAALAVLSTCVDFKKRSQENTGAG